jgi:group I intron endonuclease
MGKKTYIYKTMTGVYKIQSTKRPDLIYIGSSINIEKRWKEHMDSLRLNKHSNKKLQNHFNNNPNDLSLSIIICCDASELDLAEQFFIDTYKTYFNISKIVTKRGKKLSGLKP